MPFNYHKALTLDVLNDSTIATKEKDLWVQEHLNYHEALNRYFDARLDLVSIEWRSAFESFIMLAEQLFGKVMTRDYSSFHLESLKEQVINAVRKLDILSLLNDFEDLPKLHPMVRMKSYLRDADKVLKYIEDYTDAILDWITVAGMFRETF